MSALSGLMGKIEGLGTTVALKGRAMIDSVFPPEKRNELLAKIQAFALKNPKVSAFLLTNFVLTGPPLFLFVLFTITVLIFSIVVALVVGLLFAVGFTLFAVLTALFVLFPTVFFTTLAATFFFLWGLGGYYILKWFNKGESPAPEGSAIGDKLNSLTGNRLGFLMDNARDTQANGSAATANHKKTDGDAAAAAPNGKPKQIEPKTNGTPTKGGMDGVKKQADVAKHADTLKKNANVGNATDKVTKNASVDGATKATGLDNATKPVGADGLTKKVGGTTGTIKGGLGGATGLA
ncbi:hypothetical protein MBLNU459_g8318t1 [Dothideomycetes sp. NU459]